MIEKIKMVLPNWIINFIKNFIRINYTRSYSQDGEDKILDRLFDSQRTGFYVDVGAHHPKRFSNTYFFYRKGWKGINIDAMPNSMNIFNLLRSRDINIEIPIANQDTSLIYYAFEESALNGFSEELSQLRIADGHKLIFKKEIKTHRLADILSKYLPLNQEIDFLSIDVEGLDFDVLKSNDWDKFKPKVLLVEIYSPYIKDLLVNEVYLYLNALGYDVVSKTPNTTILCLKKDIK